MSDVMATAPTAAILPLRPKTVRGERWRRGFRTIRRNRLAFVGLIVITIAIVVAIGAPVLAPHDERAIAVRDKTQSPSLEHPMGTDNLGRDVFSRVLFGVRMSVLIAGSSIGAAALIGVLLGLISGYFRGWVDEAIMRLMDMLYAFPDLLLALALVATFGTGLEGLIIAIAIGRIPGFARVTRATVLALRENEYVDAARTVGLRDWQIIFRHILPNGIAPIIVMTSISLALAILVEASLSFLGLGIQPPTPSLGGLLKDALGFMEQAPWMAIFPGLAIAFIVFALNVLGDGLRDALDPNLK
jgi:ABC-type dipeptide/oligopeptide/nickel transport system permease subunit